MSFEVFVSDLRSVYSEAQLADKTDSCRLTKSHLQRWSELLGLSKESVCTEIALYLALGFHRKELTFEFCDAIINDLFYTVVWSGNELPDLVDAVYEAFDFGEYIHQDRPDDDPVETFTRPMIAQIVEVRCF